MVQLVPHVIHALIPELAVPLDPCALASASPLPRAGQAAPTRSATATLRRSTRTDQATPLLVLASPHRLLGGRWWTDAPGRPASELTPRRCSPDSVAPHYARAQSPPPVRVVSPGRSSLLALARPFEASGAPALPRARSPPSVRRLTPPHPKSVHAPAPDPPLHRQRDRRERREGGGREMGGKKERSGSVS
jgi:hypothetical protein